MAGPAGDDEVVVAIPDDSVVIPGVEGDKPETKTDAPKDDAKWRASSVAKRGAEDPDAKRITTLERERDEHARIAEEARQRATQLEADRRSEAEARARAEEVASRREAQAMGAHWARLNSDKTQIEVAIGSAQERELSARQRFIAARESGDASAEADAMKVMSEATAAIAQLEQGKIAAERQLEETRRYIEDYQQQAKQPKPEPEKKPDPVPKVQTADDWINGTARPALGDDGAAWLAENKQFVTDPRQNRLFLAFADLYAAEHGQSALKSEEFLEALNDKFFPDKEEREERTERRREPEPEPERPRSRAPTSAPVSRNRDQFFSSRNLNASQVKLPPKLASFVKASGLDPTQYALETVAAIKAGTLPKNFLDPDYDHGI